MTDFIKDIQINNFKSLKHCELRGCKRINLLIGRPNTGKTNILEALSVFSLPFLLENETKKITSFIRMEHAAELFTNGDVNEKISILTNLGQATLRYDKNAKLMIGFELRDGSAEYMADEKLSLKHKKGSSSRPFVRKYSFKSGTRYRVAHEDYLIPPFGANLFSVIEQLPALRAKLKDFICGGCFGELLEDGAHGPMGQEKVMVHRFEKSFHTISDGIRRLWFYKAAIASGSGSVMVLENVDAHLAPSAVADISRDIINAKESQFMIATQSPVMLEMFLKKVREQLSIFVVDCHSFQTVARKLNDFEMQEILRNRVDLFTNCESYLPR